LRSAILASAGFSCIATDEAGIIQIFNAGAQRMLGYTRAEVVNIELATALAPGFEALARKAARGIEDTHQLSCIRKDGSRLAAAVSVTTLRNPASEIIGYLLIAIESGTALETPEPVLPPAPNGVPTRRLLYVEEQPASLGLVEQLIAGHTDMQLLRAADLKSGIELARSERPEVILLNLDLAGIDAVHFMKSVQNTPVLALSANGAPDAIVKALEAGFFHYLTQPLKPQSFLEALADALEFAAQERAEQNDMPLRKTQPLKESE